jgi:hypothetical protein
MTTSDNTMPTNDTTLNNTTPDTTNVEHVEHTKQKKRTVQDFSNSFKPAIKKIISQIKQTTHYRNNVYDRTKSCLNDLTVKFVEKVIAKMFAQLENSKSKTLNENLLVNVIRMYYADNELADILINKGQNALTKLNNFVPKKDKDGKVIKRTTKGFKADILVQPSTINTIINKKQHGSLQGKKYQVAKGTPVILAAIVEYILRTVLSGAFQVTNNNNSLGNHTNVTINEMSVINQGFVKYFGEFLGNTVIYGIGLYNNNEKQLYVVECQQTTKKKTIKKKAVKKVTEEVREEVREEVSEEVKEEVSEEVKEEVSEEVKEEVSEEVKE